jgi:hypothetical protein
MAIGQPQIDVWALILRIAKWATRIPLAALAIFIAACMGFLGFYLVLRITQWVWVNWLQNPWY